MDDATRTALAAEYPCLTPTVLNLIQNHTLNQWGGDPQHEINDHAREMAAFVALILNTLGVNA